MRPKVTVGICVRNGASAIGEVIESVMAQGYPHELIEVIFVDDGSTDNTLSLINNYAAKMDMKVKVFHHQWKGLGASRNVVVNNPERKKMGCEGRKRVLKEYSLETTTQKLIAIYNQLLSENSV